jgi:hypothetical protein
MESSRLPRFKRVSPATALELKERDRAIIHLVHRHRFLLSTQITKLIGGSSQQILRRLKLLYHHGYLERPRCQIDSYHKPGSRHIVYGLGNKGGLLLKRELGSAFRLISWGEKNRAVGRIYLEHALLVAAVMTAIELACRNANIRLLTEQELVVPGQKPAFRWKAKVYNRVQIGVVPDRVFALEYRNQGGETTRSYFFLEADRGTMPVTRRNLSQTSFYRKLLAYEATWSQSLHKSKFGFPRFRVVTVTQSAVRVQSLIDACSQLKRGHGLFLFADQSILDAPDNILLPVWKSGRNGEASGLLD